MFAAPSSHKRRRASARGDKARKRAPGRVVLNAVAPLEDTQEALDAAHARFRNVVEAHAFNHKVSLIVPSSSSPTLVTSLSSIASGAHSVLARVSLRVFLAPEFVSQHVKGTNLVALSIDSLESDDVVCLDGQGTLILSVTKATYQTLGLVGRPSRYAIGASGRTGDRKSGPVERYIIEVPLTDPSFVPGKPGWTRVAECFERWEKETGLKTIFFAAEHGSEVRFPDHVHAQSLAKVGLEVHEDTLQDVWVPSLEERSGSSRSEMSLLRRGWQDGETKDDALPWDDWSEALSELAEWKALVERDAECIKTYHRPNPFDHNSYTAPEPRSPGSVSRISLSGFLHPSTVVAIETTLREHLDSSSSSVWAMMSCEGFADSPVRWRSQDPGLGLALGQGKPAIAPSHEDYDDESSDDDDDSNSDSEDDDDDHGILSSLSGPALTGKAARRKRSRQVKRKGHLRKGEAERSASIASAAAAGGQGGAFGWSAVVFGRKRSSISSKTAAAVADTKGGAQRDARYIWWENVEGDTRS